MAEKQHQHSQQKEVKKFKEIEHLATIDDMEGRMFIMSIISLGKLSKYVVELFPSQLWAIHSKDT